MVSKVDRTVDSCIIFKKIATVATSRQSIFRGSCLIDFSGKVASKSPNSYKMASKSLKKFRQSQQSTTWQIRDPATVDFSRESWPYCRLWFQKLTIVDYGFKNWLDGRLPRFSSNECRLLKKKAYNSRCLTKSRLSTGRLGCNGRQSALQG